MLPMISLDVRTIILFYMVTTFICFLFVLMLWLQNRGRYAGVGFWVADFVLQGIGFSLVFLRGLVPDSLSIIAGNLLILSGFVVLIMGIEIFYGLKASYKVNFFVLLAFTLCFRYFSAYAPSLMIRTIVLSAVTFLISIQGVRLVFKRIPAAAGFQSRTVGYIFASYSVFSVVRIANALFQIRGNEFMTRANDLDTVFLIIYQILFVALTISLAHIIFERMRREIATSSEEKIRQREAYLRSIIETLPGRIWLKDTEGHFLAVNRVFAEFFGFKSADDLTGKTDFDILSEDVAVKVLETDKTIMQDATARFFEELIDHRDQQLWVENYRAPIFDSQGRLWGTVGYSQDISERKKNEEDLIAAKERAEQSERRIQKGLEEKEMLLRELYHRTKNNMQVIQSIIQLRAFISDSQIIRDFAREIEQKILSMALVHQKLYQSGDLSHIQLHDYIEELTELMLHSFNSEYKKIMVYYTMKPVTVLIDVAIPCGLVVNELLTNAFKYAHNGKNETQILIELMRKEDGRISLCISDNGEGFPADFDLTKQKNLGLQTVFELIEKQLHGTIDYETSQKGLKFSIAFSDKVYHQRV